MSTAQDFAASLKFGAKVVDDDADYSEGAIWLPHPSVTLNLVTGGGLPYGRIIEFMGEYSSGKSVTAYEFLAQAQQRQGIGILVDAEQAYDTSFGEKLGIDNSQLLIYPGDVMKAKGEEEMKKEEIRMRSVERVSAFLEDVVIKARKHYPMPAPVVIAVDSITALTTLKQAEEDMDKSNRDMTKAQALGIMYTRLVGIVKKMNVTLIFINQMREKIDTLPGKSFGDKEKSTGGRGLEFFASMRLQFFKSGATNEAFGVKAGKLLDANKVKLGQVSRIHTLKNKLYPPFIQAEILQNFNRFENVYGTDPYYGLVDALKTERIITVGGGGWYQFGDDKLGQGEVKTLQLLQDNEDLLAEMLKLAGLPVGAIQKAADLVEPVESKKKPKAPKK